MNACRTALLRRAVAAAAPARFSSTFAVASRRTATSSSLHTPTASSSSSSSSFFSTSSVSHNAAPADTPSQDGAAAAAAAAPAAEADAAPAALSSCPEGTVLVGLNYTKGRTDPVALRDEEYPSWLWNCLDVMKKAATTEDADAGDEFSKSKKQRRMALRRQRELEAKVLATGDLTALAPKIPLQHQTVNLPVGAERAEGQPAPTQLEDTLAAAGKRKELRVAMRKERRAKIKESNYLRSM
ncbi:ribosomal protein l37, mitochondrial [Sporothrix schenckii 1099-18]|uniref:Large ribosomal subunit protein mL54 n=2 Tax=Sporothrix schenckii TaxID=29908 RepID=U7PJ46_SPOS1|nr:ribosomal protein l37, mitochondrial [Sporothrix schenckii 1099-18]ERS95557.1 hypothetical protein HMPREF1624_08073 [Sporothrix schenckii ATCC 58251]KJR86736.1 ribosomal protein l37, mitochondrial [Sporothrix schenckii 1099-18]